MRAIFCDLLPTEVQVSDPCAVLLRTNGRRGGPKAAAEAVVLIDRRLALARVAAGAEDDLSPLFALNPQDFHVMADGDPAQIQALVALCSAHGPVHVGDPAQPPQPWFIDDYGVYNADILMNGLTISAAPTGFVRRLGLISKGCTDPTEIEGAVLDFVRRARAEPGVDLSRALSLVLDGGLENRWQNRHMIQVAERQGMVLKGLVLRTIAPEVVTTALEEAVFHGLLGRPVAVRCPQAGLDCPEIPRLKDLKNHVLGVLGPHRRRADDATRATCFRALAASRFEGGHSQKIEAEICELLGPTDVWIAAYRRHLKTPAARVVLLPTWQCELRCVYCAIAKTDAREMSEAVGISAVSLLFSAPTPKLTLAFFGGEPLLRWPLVAKLCEQAVSRAATEGRELDVQITTNAWALTEDQIIQMKRWNTHLQLSLDGDERTQNAQRKPLESGGDSYARGPAAHLDTLHRHGLDYRLIMVVSPSTVAQMVDNFEHLVGLGARCIQLNYAIGIPWDVAASEQYAAGLACIGERVEALWASGHLLDWVNLREAPVSVRNNLHVTVDFDGTVYGGNAFLVQASGREKFRLGNLDEHHGWHRYMVDGKSDADVFSNWKRRASVEETTRVGAVEASYVRWMQGRHPQRLGRGHTRSL